MRFVLAVLALFVCPAFAAEPQAPPEVGAFVLLDSPLTVEIRASELPDGIPYSRLKCAIATGPCTYLIKACELLTVQSVEPTKIVVKDSLGVETWFAWTKDESKRHFFPKVYARKDILGCLKAIEPKPPKG